MNCYGHSSITVTLDQYGHLFPSLDQSLTEGLENTWRESLADFSRTDRGLVVELAAGATP